MTSSRVMMAARHPTPLLLQLQRLRRPSLNILDRLNRYSPSFITGFPNRFAVNTGTGGSSSERKDSEQLEDLRSQNNNVRENASNVGLKQGLFAFAK